MAANLAPVQYVIMTPATTEGDPVQKRDLYGALGVGDELADYVAFPEEVSKQMKITLVLSWVAFTIYVFGLPFWSMLFNDYFRFAGDYCHTPAEEIDCYGDRTFLEIAKTAPAWANRLRNGTYYGCGCGEGVFPEWMCSIKTMTRAGIENGMVGFSISYYIGTAPATGAMAGFSAFPIASMWWYGMGNPNVALHRFGEGSTSKAFQFTWVSLIFYQASYFFFLTCTGCMFGAGHIASVGIFITAATVHFAGIAVLSMRKKHRLNTLELDIIVVLVAVACVGMFLGFASYAFPSIQGYGFMYAEALGLSLVFAVTPALAVIPSHSRSSSDDEAEEEDETPEEEEYEDDYNN